MIEKSFAIHFAADWIDSWNSHALDRILAHYDDSFEMSSPYIVHIANDPSGTLTGKTAVRTYWEKALQRFPDLQFELITTLVCVDSITIYYKSSVSGLAAEVLYFNGNQKVIKAFAHYAV